MKTKKNTKPVAKAKAAANEPEIVIDLTALDDALSDAVGTLLAVQSLLRMIQPEDDK
jgi:hypothetical protein